jgi:sec-independent protein translocase protein TatA
LAVLGDPFAGLEGHFGLVGRRFARRGGENVFGLGLQELIIIMVIVFVIFGGKKLPELGSGLGKAIREFKRGTSEPDEIDVSPKEAIEQKETAAPTDKGGASQDRTRPS